MKLHVCLVLSSHTTIHCMMLTSPDFPVLGLALAPSLTPAPQPTISLLSDNDAETLSVDSLTLLPPADPPRLRSFSTQSSIQDDPPADGEETATPGHVQDDGERSSDTQEDKKDISVIPEEDEASPESAPSEMNSLKDSTLVKPTTDHAGDREDNPDLEEETAID